MLNVFLHFFRRLITRTVMEVVTIRATIKNGKITALYSSPYFPGFCSAVDLDFYPLRSEKVVAAVFEDLSAKTGLAGFDTPSDVEAAYGKPATTRMIVENHKLRSGQMRRRELFVTMENRSC